jgi:hypothetical protein
MNGISTTDTAAAMRRSGIQNSFLGVLSEISPRVRKVWLLIDSGFVDGLADTGPRYLETHHAKKSSHKRCFHPLDFFHSVLIFLKPMRNRDRLRYSHWGGTDRRGLGDSVRRRDWIPPSSKHPAGLSQHSAQPRFPVTACRFLPADVPTNLPPREAMSIVRGREPPTPQNGQPITA